MKKIISTLVLLLLAFGIFAQTKIYRGDSTNFSDCLYTVKDDKIFKGNSTSYFDCVLTISGNKIYRGNSTSYFDCLYIIKDGKKVWLVNTHHIVHQQLANQPLLKRAGYNIHSKENLIRVPTQEGKKHISTSRSVHSGPHGVNSVASIARKLSAAEKLAKQENWNKEKAFAEVKKIIREEELKILNGIDLKK